MAAVHLKSGQESEDCRTIDLQIGNIDLSQIKSEFYRVQKREQMAVLKVDNLKVYYRKNGFLQSKKTPLKAVDGVSFELHENEILGLVGESGCGKSTLGRALVRLEEVESGSVMLDDVDVLKLKGKKLRKFRKNIQFIFQDPYSSLNPRMTVGEILDEVLAIHTELDKSWRERKIAQLLEQVGISATAMNRYIHQFSGGQRQRIGIARALAVQPKVIIADEPVSALDVSVQSQIINLLSDIREKSRSSFIFIAHDLAVVEHISDRIMVMYLGKIVESGPSHEVCANPQHPYTKALLSAVPKLELNTAPRIMLKGDVPSACSEIKGCAFYSRCPMKHPECLEHESFLMSANGSDEHYTSCLFPEEVKNL